MSNQPTDRREGRSERASATDRMKEINWIDVREGFQRVIDMQLGALCTMIAFGGAEMDSKKKEQLIEMIEFGPSDLEVVDDLLEALKNKMHFLMGVVTELETTSHPMDSFRGLEDASGLTRATFVACDFAHLPLWVDRKIESRCTGETRITCYELKYALETFSALLRISVNDASKFDGEALRHLSRRIDRLKDRIFPPVPN